MQGLRFEALWGFSKFLVTKEFRGENFFDPRAQGQKMFFFKWPSTLLKPRPASRGLTRQSDGQHWPIGVQGLTRGTRLTRITMLNQGLRGCKIISRHSLQLLAQWSRGFTRINPCTASLSLSRPCNPRKPCVYILLIIL